MINSVDELYDIYLSALVVIEVVTPEYASKHCINPIRAVLAIEILKEQVIGGERELVLPRLLNSREAIDLVKSFIDESLPIELLEDGVVIKPLLKP